MNFDPGTKGPNDPLDGLVDESRLVVPICEAPSWKPEPFKVAPFYTTKEMAKMLKADPSTLRRWRRLKEPEGPTATRITDRSWRYYHADFIEWLNKRGQPMDAA